jgi:uncharacterized membrane protein YdbT with pleckstrin-like domain
MGYVENNLMPKEEIIHKSRLHWIVYVRPIVWIAIWAIIFIVADDYYDKINNPGAETYLFAAIQILAAIIVVLNIIGLINSAIAKYTTELAVTNKRLFIKTGLIRRDTVELQHSKVESLSVNQGLLGRLLNYGTVYVGAAGHSNKYPSIAAPIEFRQKAMVMMDQ